MSAVSTRQRRFGRVLAAGWGLVIAAATLWPMPHNTLIREQASVWCLVCGSAGLVDVVLNIALFVPLGLSLRLSGVSLGRTVLWCGLLSLSIEVVQSVVPGRFAGVSDILTNTTGALLGAAFLAWGPTAVRPAAQVARLLFAVALLLWGGLWAGTAFLLQPALPEEHWNGLIAPFRPPYEQFTGSVLEVSLASIPIRWEALPRAAHQRAAFLAGDSISATVVAGPETRRFAPIAVVAAHPDRILILLGQRGRSMEMTVRLRASDLRLRSPAVQADRAFSSSRGDTVTVWGGVRDGGVYAGSTSGPGRTLRLRPSLGWMLLLPFDRPVTAAGAVALLAVIWIVLHLTPLAYWSRWTERRGLALTALLIVVLLGLGLVPPAFGLTATPLYEWAAAAAAIAGGRWAASRCASIERAAQ